MLSPRLVALLALAPGVAAAQVAPEPAATTQPAQPAERQSPVPAPQQPQGLFDRDALLGDIDGVRTGLAAYGLKLGLTETDELLGNVSGGVRTGLVYEGLTTASLDLDLSRIGGIARVSALQLHGRGLSLNDIGNLQTVSSIEGTRATRLFELWYQQSFLGGKVDLKLGQQSADLEFATSAYAGLFVNSSFGWPGLFAVDLPAGGPAYPLAALGARLRVKPVEPLTLMLAVFNGSPSAPGSGDPQGPQRNPSGTEFRLGDGAFVIGEIQYATTLAGRDGTYKLGAWYNSNAFTNQFYTVTSSIDAAPGAVPPRAARGDWSIYAVADQLLWRKPGASDGGLATFLRIAGAPGDRNQVELFVNAGLTYKGVFGRDNDTVGLGVSTVRIGGSARQGDAALALTQPDYPIRTSETVLELSYQGQLAPAVQLQPVAQYVFNPGGGIPDPIHAGRRIPDAAVIGIRSNITF